MANDWKWISAAALGGAGFASLGFLLWSRRCKTSKSTKPASYVGKSYELSDLLTLYIKDHNSDDKVLGELRNMSVAHKNGKMTTCVEVGKVLTFYCRALNARKAIDVGVFTGCSAFSLALGLQEGGKVVACDISEEYTSLGKPFWERGGVSGKIDLRIGKAVETLQELLDNGEAGSFDIMFIDADKLNYCEYYKLGVELLRKGGVIVVDNALWSGMVANPAKLDEYTIAIRSLNEQMKEDPRVDYVLLNFADGVGIAQKL